MSEDAIFYAEQNLRLLEIIAKQKDELDFLKRHIFGKKSERFITVPGQLSLDGFGVQLPEPVVTFSSPVIPEIKEKQKPVRKPLDESSYEVIVEDIHPEGDLQQMKFIGIEESTHKVVVDAKIVLKKIKRYKYQNRETGEIIIADMPYRPFAKSAVSASIISEVVVQKFVDGQPIYRQMEAWKRLGVDFSYSSLSDMQRMGYDLIKPLFEAFQTELMSTHFLQVDESPIKVLSSEKKGATHKGFYYVVLDPIQNRVLYNYRPHKNHKITSELLKDFRGVLQSDGYEGYDHFAKNQSGVTHIYCMAHARRYFKEAEKNDAERAHYFLKEVQKLYDIERVLKEKKITGNEKVLYRKEHALPILNNLKIWIEAQLPHVTQKSSIGQAILYSRARWDGLSEYCNYDFAEIDNNPVERSIRPMVIGRKNYLFAATNESAQRAACYYTFFITCRLHGVNPKAWIEDVFEKIEHLKPSQYHTLFPQNWGK